MHHSYISVPLIPTETWSCTILTFRYLSCPLKHGHAPFLHFSASHSHWNMVMHHSYISVSLLSSALTPLPPTVGKQPGLLSCIEEAHTPYDLCRNRVTTVSTTSNSAPGTNRCLYTVLWQAAIGLVFLCTVSWKQLHILQACNISFPSSSPRFCHKCTVEMWIVLPVGQNACCKCNWIPFRYQCS